MSNSGMRFSYLSRPAILAARKTRKIVIDPFDRRNLGTNSYDVRLGEHYWKEVEPLRREALYNPYSKEAVYDAWRLHQALPLEQSDARGLPIVGVKKTDKVIIVYPGETLLCHTEEFIGSCCDHITSNMRGRSTTARNRIKICSDAGLGDVGYFNRWTMEITNLGRARTILVCGRRIGQIEFIEVEPVGSDYTQQGKYQKYATLEEVKENWHPEDMLPRQWLDWELNDE